MLKERSVFSLTRNASVDAYSEPNASRRHGFRGPHGFSQGRHERAPGTICGARLPDVQLRVLADAARPRGNPNVAAGAAKRRRWVLL